MEELYNVEDKKKKKDLQQNVLPLFLLPRNIVKQPMDLHMLYNTLEVSNKLTVAMSKRQISIKDLI